MGCHDGSVYVNNADTGELINKISANYGSIYATPVYMELPLSSSSLQLSLSSPPFSMLKLPLSSSNSLPSIVFASTRGYILGSSLVSSSLSSCCFDKDEHASILWIYHITNSSPVFSTPIVFGNRIIYALVDGNIQCIEITDSQSLSTVTTVSSSSTTSLFQVSLIWTVKASNSAFFSSPILCPNKSSGKQLLVVLLLPPLLLLLLLI